MAPLRPLASHKTPHVIPHSLTLLIYPNALHVRCSAPHLFPSLAFLAQADDLDRLDSDGATMLGTACSAGDMDTVALLLDHGADVNGADKEGQSPLWLSVYAGKEELARLLLNHSPRANVNQARNNGTTPLAISAVLGHVYITQLLLHHHADPYVADNDGVNALLHAARYGNGKAAKLIAAAIAERSKARSNARSNERRARGGGGHEYSTRAPFGVDDRTPDDSDSHSRSASRTVESVESETGAGSAGESGEEGGGSVCDAEALSVLADSSASAHGSVCTSVIDSDSFSDEDDDDNDDDNDDEIAHLSERRPSRVPPSSDPNRQSPMRGNSSATARRAMRRQSFEAEDPKAAFRGSTCMAEADSDSDDSGKTRTVVVSQDMPSRRAQLSLSQSSKEMLGRSGARLSANESQGGLRIL